MDNSEHIMLSELAEILKSFDNDLDFEVVDEVSAKFNLDKAGYRYTYNTVTKKYIKSPLNKGVGGSTDEVAPVSCCIVDPNGYLFISNDLCDIPFLHALGINYIVGHNDSVFSNYITEMNEVPVILTVKNQQEIEVIQNMFGITTPFVNIDFNELCEEYTKDDSLLDLSVKLQGSGEGGSEGVNKFLFSKAKKYTDTVIAQKSVETETLVNDVDITDDENLAVEGDVEIPLLSDENIPPKTTTYKKLLLTQLEDDKKYQLRVEEDQSAIRDLAQAYNDGETIPPIDVVQVGTERYIIVDGHHRYAAAKESGIESMECFLTEGSEYDALVLSLGANANNKALKRTNADKRNAVTKALSYGDFVGYSNREIADLCKVSSTFVDKIVKQLQQPALHDNDTSTANVCTKDDLCSEENDSTTPPITCSTTKEDAIPASPSSSPKKKLLTESVKNKYISLSVSINTKPKDETALHGLLTDLQQVINEYTTEFEEVI